MMDVLCTENLSGEWRREKMWMIGYAMRFLCGMHGASCFSNDGGWERRGDEELERAEEETGRALDM